MWERYDEMEVRLSAGLSERMLELAGLGAGQRVVDVASGRGEPAIRAAQRVGAAGQVIGTDRAGDVLAMARARARREGVSNVEFRVADAETLASVADAWADVVLSRWGLMYFAEPVRALRAMRRVLGSDGVAVIAVWAEAERVPWYELPRRVLGRFHPVEPVDLARPGACFYGDPARLVADLEAAGFVVERTEERAVPVMEARTDDELVDWVLAFAGSAVVKTFSEALKCEWRRALVAAAEAHRVGEVVRLGGVTRLVVARRGRELGAQAAFPDEGAEGQERRE